MIMEDRTHRAGRVHSMLFIAYTRALHNPDKRQLVMVGTEEAKVHHNRLLADIAGDNVPSNLLIRGTWELEEA